MSEWLVKAIDLAKASWNVVSSVGPFLISQSDRASEAYARHQARLAAVDAAKELVLQEISALGEAKAELIRRFSDASPTDRIRIRKDIEELEASLRQLKIGAQALSYTTPGQDSDRPQLALQAGAAERGTISDHWLDKFRELTRAHNEEWREDLLARALAAESAAPGGVSTRVLWLLGTLEHKQFLAFAEVLNLCMTTTSGLVVPNCRGSLFSRPIPDCGLGSTTSVGNLVYRLQETGLIADILTTRKTLTAGRHMVAYGERKQIIDCTSRDLEVHGIIPTPLGTSIARFCSTRENELGYEIFDDWLSTLPQKSVRVFDAPG